MLLARARLQNGLALNETSLFSMLEMRSMMLFPVLNYLITVLTLYWLQKSQHRKPESMYFTTPSLENKVTRKPCGSNVMVELQVKGNAKTKRGQ